MAANSASGAVIPIVAPTVTKDTVRIEVPVKARAVQPPQATVKLPVQPFLQRPIVQPGTLTTLPAVATAPTIDEDENEVAAEDPTMTYFSGGVLVFSAVVLLLQVLDYLSLSAN